MSEDTTKPFPPRTGESRRGGVTRDGLIGAARAMRKEPTEAEKTLWEALRRKQADGLRFRRQRVIGPYIVDFCCLSHKLIVEVDGTHHHDPEQLAYDHDRTQYLESHGYHLLRFDNTEVLTDVEAVIQRIVIPSLTLPSSEGKEENEPNTPHSSPLREGERAG